jgi:hypothetical protein
MLAGHPKLDANERYARSQTHALRAVIEQVGK